MQIPRRQFEGSSDKLYRPKFKSSQFSSIETAGHLQYNLVHLSVRRQQLGVQKNLV